MSFNQSTEAQGLKVGDKAPQFEAKSHSGKIINLSDYKGKKVLLSFHRNVGCPICNLRFHELEAESDYFKSKNLILLAVYESSVDNMKQFVEGENFYTIMIPNPDLSLYKLYDVERSTGKMLKGMFHGAMSKIKKGKKLFKKQIKQDGTANRIGADFLIDEKGNVLKAYYGKYIGDDLPIHEIKKFLN